MTQQIVRELINGEWVTKVEEEGTGTGTVDSVTAGDATITVGGSIDNPTVRVTANTFQPLDADLTAIAALTTTPYGRALLELANQGALLTATGAQPSDADLTAIAALTTTPYGRSLLTLADQAALQAEAGGGGGSSYDPLGWGMAVNAKPSTAIADYFWDTANRGYFWRLMNGKENAANVRMEIIASAGDISLALYSNTGVGSSARPGTLLVATGAVASPGTSLRTFALGSTVDVLPGDWIGMTSSTNTLKLMALYAGIQLSEVFAGFGGYADGVHPLSGSNPSFDGNGLPGAVLLQVV